jgi:hypothetical protein
MRLLRQVFTIALIFWASNRAAAQAQGDPFEECRQRLPDDIKTQLLEKDEGEQNQWLAANCNEVSLTYLRCRGQLNKKQRDDYALVPEHLKRSWLRSHCSNPAPGRFSVAPNSAPPPRSVLAMVGATGGSKFTDEDRKQLQEVVRLVITAELSYRQIHVVGPAQITDAPCDKNARQQAAQITNATTVVCFHSMVQGEDTLIGLALYDANTDKVIRSVVLPVAGAQAADIAHPLQVAAKALVTEGTKQSNQYQDSSTLFEEAGRFREKPRRWVAIRVTGGILFGLGLSSLVPGLILAGLLEGGAPQLWVPSVSVGGAFTLIGGALLGRSEAQKRSSSGVSLLPLRGGVGLGLSRSF